MERRGSPALLGEDGVNVTMLVYGDQHSERQLSEDL